MRLNRFEEGFIHLWRAKLAEMRRVETKPSTGLSLIVSIVAMDETRTIGKKKSRGVIETSRWVPCSGSIRCGCPLCS